MTVDLGQRRLGRLAGAVVASAGVLSWAALLARLQLRALHILQLEGYQTGRYLRWSVQQRGRWASKATGLGGIGAIGLGALDLASGARVARSRLGLAAWAALGGWLWRSARPGRPRSRWS